MRDDLSFTAMDLARFWARVNKTPDCWLWTGEVNNQGYGRHSLWRGGRKRVLAHRFAYLLATGEAPEVVMHVCDTPRCVRRRHLVAGDQAANMSDCVQKGRHSPPPVHSGTAHHFAKVDHTLAAQIRDAYAAGGVTQAVLATRFGVSQNTVSRIVRGKAWVAGSGAKGGGAASEDAA